MCISLSLSPSLSLSLYDVIRHVNISPSFYHVNPILLTLCRHVIHWSLVFWKTTLLNDFSHRQTNTLYIMVFMILERLFSLLISSSRFRMIILLPINVNW